MEVLKPTLTEFSTKYYIRNSLKEVRKVKDKYITIGVNIFLLLLFVGTVSALLYYKYKGKPSPEENAIKEQQKKEYLFNKLQQYSNDKQKQNQNLITNLPII